MLSPEYLEQLPTAMVQLFGQLEEDIIIDMARRIAKTGTLTDTAEYQAYRLQELGAQRRYVMQRLSRITGKAKEELNAIFADAARTTLAYDNELFEQAGYSPAPLDENAELRQLVQAYRKQTSELFFNLTQTTARTASKQFERALDRAAMQMTSGAFSYQQAIRTAVKSLAAKGVDTIVYRKNGHITQVTSTDVAVRRAVLTGVNQMASHVQLANAEQLGCDLVQVTAHGGARPEHAEWQGGIYSISGKHPKYKKLSTATGYGTGEGLCGWNCRHNFFPFFEGLSEPANTAKQLWDMENAAVTYNGEQIPLYEATQRQRSIERAIRRWKREYLAMEAAGQDTTEAAVKLKKWRMIQADFCEKTGLRVDGFRGQVQGFGRSAASKASATAQKSHSAWLKSIGAQDSKLENIANYYTAQYNNTVEYQLLRQYARNVQTGWISPLVGFDMYKNLCSRIENEIIGQKTADGVLITSQVGHFIQRVVGTMIDPEELHGNLRIIRRSGVEIDEIKKALFTPTAIDPIQTRRSGQKSKRYISENCVVSINPDTGQLVQTNPL